MYAHLIMPSTGRPGGEEAFKVLLEVTARSIESAASSRELPVLVRRGLEDYRYSVVDYFPFSWVAFGAATPNQLKADSKIPIVNRSVPPWPFEWTNIP
jgi:hypothetical protein